MRKAKTTGALVVSLVLAAAMVILAVSATVKVGTEVYKMVTGETQLGVSEPNGEEDSADVFVQDGDVSWADVSTADGSYASSVEMVKYTEDGQMYAEIIGHLDNGGTWHYYTPYYEMTELDPITEIFAYDDLYLFCAGGEVIALDTATGDELWKNYDFGGYEPAFDLDENRTMYLCGYYGPDLCVIDINGNTLRRVEMFSSDYTWPCEIMKADDGKIKITYASGPDGNTASILYNMEEDNFYVFDGELTLASEMETWMSVFMSHKLDDSMKKYEQYALVHIDGDGIPEMVGRCDEGFVVLHYYAGDDSVYVKEFTGGDFNYYLGTGVFCASRYDYVDEGSEHEQAYYSIEGKEFRDLGHFWYMDVMQADGSYETDFKYNGAETDSDTYYDAMSKIDEAVDYQFSDYPNYAIPGEIDKYIMSWNDPSDDEAVWKELLGWEVEYRKDYEGYLLQDFDGNGVPEMFVHDSESYGDFGNFIVCDVRTHQIYTEYTSADLMGWLKGTNILFDTTISGSMSMDALYELNESKLIKTVDAWRMEDYYFVNNQQTSEEEYAEAFGVLLTGEAVMLTDLCGTYEEFVAKLQ